MDYDLFFKRVVEQLEIAIGLKSMISDFKIIDLPEEFGISFAHGQPAGIILDIAVNLIQRSRRIKDAVIEILLEDCFMNAC